jgi:hypothetical protein
VFREEFYFRYDVDSVDPTASAFVFKDLTSEQAASPDLYMSIRIYRQGTMKDDEGGYVIGKGGSKNNAYYRRPYGAAVIPLSKRLEATKANKELFVTEKDFYISSSEKHFGNLHNVILEEG